MINFAKSTVGNVTVKHHSTSSLIEIIVDSKVNLNI